MATKAQWTHKSVRTFGGDDPVGAMRDRARKVVLEALAAGWPGPPFDPIWLAEFRGLSVAPKEDIRDARTVPASTGGFVIEYNPTKPRNRVRYSIAHEIAHTFFEDCAERVRNRADQSEMTADDWQLEMLCNVGASELVMPIGSFPDLKNEPLSIDRLMDIRREFDVSTEALLLRFIRLTDHPCAFFACSRVEQGGFEGRYRIDYAIASRTWVHAIPVGAHLRDGSIVGECVAIGYTAKGKDVWPGEPAPMDLQCVGVTPHPGSCHPRVLGLATIADVGKAAVRHIIYVVGDATSPRGPTPQLIVQVMNDTSTAWAAGFSRALVSKYAEAQVDYRKWASVDGNKARGNVHFFGHPEGVEIATIIAQRGFGRSKEARIDYPALKEGLERVAKRALETKASVHMPRIGCGLAGGKWDVVGELVDVALVQAGISVTVYDIPTKSGRRGT